MLEEIKKMKLTEEQITQFIQRQPVDTFSIRQFARNVEAAVLDAVAQEIAALSKADNALDVAYLKGRADERELSKPPEIGHTELICFMGTYFQHQGNIPDEADYHNGEKWGLVTRVLDEVSEWNKPPDDCSEPCPTDKNGHEEDCNLCMADHIFAKLRAAGWKSPEEVAELQEELRVSNSLTAKLTDQCRELELKLNDVVERHTT